MQKEKRIPVLVVEDNELLLSFYASSLSDLAEVRLITAQNGFEGLIEVSAHNPQIAIVDLDMPRFNGFQMLGILAKDTSYCPKHIFVVSGLDEEEIERRGGIPPHAELVPKKRISAESIHSMVKEKLLLMKNTTCATDVRSISHMA